jgi:hypothetical protein
MMKRISSATLAALALSMITTGCYRTSIVNGRPEAPPDAIPALNGTKHGGYVNGIAEDNPLHLQHLCKQGWTSIKIETGFLASLSNFAYGLIFHSQDVTVNCAPEGVAPQAAPAAAPPPSPAAPAAPAAPSVPSRI